MQAMPGTKGFLFVLVAAALALAGWQAGLLFSQAPRTPASVPLDDSVVSFRILFGVTDAAPAAWDGSLAVQGGEVLHLRHWRPRTDWKITGKTSWSLGTLRAPNFQLRAVEEERLTAPEAYFLTPGLIVDVKGSSTTRLRFTTKQGEFEVSPFDLRTTQPLSLLGGRVVVDRVPAASLLSSSETEDEFATMLHGPDGRMWAAWVAYRNKGNEILLRRFDGKAWSGAETVSGGHSDIFLVKLGRDGRGGAWAVWSAQVSGNWDLYGRRFDGQAWSAVQRLTDDPQPDIYHALATDAKGNLWVVWQGFRQGQADIFARRYDGAAWSAPARVSTSNANDWAPAVAADGAGAVYVAWDSYDKGNYDVLMRRFGDGQWSETIPVADTPKFEANVSIACDRENRVWAAWNESGFQWGKDFGFLILKQATPLYLTRPMAVAVYTGQGWEEPSADIEKSLPENLQGYNDLPVLQADGGGRMWLFFRHRRNRFPDTPRTSINHRAAWEIWGAAYEGERWSAPMPMPFSQGRADMRGGFAPDASGNLYAAWPTDQRDFEDYLFQHADVHAGRIPGLSGQAAPPKLKKRVAPRLVTYTLHADEPADLKRIRGYRIESEGKSYGIYRGDTHRHTEFSFDGNNDGSLLDAYRYSLDAASMDFLGVSEHGRFRGPDVDYINWLGQQMVDVFLVPGTFVPLFVYERSVNYPNGHRNIVFAKRGNPTFVTPPEEHAGKTGAKALFGYLKKYGGISIPHTSASNMGTDWRDNDPEVEPLVEIYQGDRVSAEYEGAPKAAYAGNPASQPGGFRPAGYVWNAWAKGYKLGVQASSDHLSTHISYACTIAEDFTREGLLEGMRKRHSYGATDNIVLDYRLQTGGREYLQGDIIEAASGEVKLVVKTIGTRPVRQIDIIRNNTFLHTRHPLEQDVSFTFVDAQPQTGESYYYVRVIQVDDQMAWSSPIWVTRR